MMLELNIWFIIINTLYLTYQKSHNTISLQYILWRVTMKKILSLFVVSFFSIVLFAQGLNETKINQVSDNSGDINNIKLGYQLANYGYENDSATALLQAAEILSQIKMQPLEVETKASGESSSEKAEIESSFDIEKLIADAKKLGKKDKNIQAWAKELEKTSKTSTRGAVGGAKWADGFVYGNNGCTYYDIFFRANELAEVTVASYNGADLDLYIYDQNGNLIAYDELNYTDCYVNFVPKWTGNFTLYIWNRNNWNSNFRLTTN